MLPCQRTTAWSVKGTVLIDAYVNSGTLVNTELLFTVFMSRCQANQVVPNEYKPP